MKIGNYAATIDDIKAAMATPDPLDRLRTLLLRLEGHGRWSEQCIEGKHHLVQQTRDDRAVELPEPVLRFIVEAPDQIRALLAKSTRGPDVAAVVEIQTLRHKIATREQRIAGVLAELHDVINNPAPADDGGVSNDAQDLAERIIFLLGGSNEGR